MLMMDRSLDKIENLEEMIFGVELAYEGKTNNKNRNSDMNMVQII